MGDDERKLDELRCEGKTLTQIAAETGRTRSGVSHKIDRLHLPRYRGRLETFLRLFQRGLGPKEVAAETGCSVKHARRVRSELVKAGHDLPEWDRSGNVRKISEAETAELVEMYRNGASRYELCTRFKCAPSTYQKWLRRAGEPMRPPGRRKKGSGRGVTGG